MQKNRITTIIIRGSIALSLLVIIFIFARSQKAEERFITYEIDPGKQALQFFCKDEQGNRFGSIEALKDWLQKKNKTLLFATNGGMYKPDHTPKGLYIENGQVLAPLDTIEGYGNFYMQPNGVFYINNNKQAAICASKDFHVNSNIIYATQSGPMLVIDGRLHPDFKEGSSNFNTRNGVGILPGGKLVFVMSKKPISLYDFANHFKSMGCKNALYLDGFVSRIYLPEKEWTQLDGDLTVMIGVTK